MPTALSSHRPRHPIVIIGAGIAGLSAALRLQQQGIPHLVLERFPRPGGRLNSRPGDGWLADHGTPYIRRSDLVLGDLTRAVGMEERRVSIQGGIHRLLPDGAIQRLPHGGIDPDRLCFDVGFGAFVQRLANSVTVRYRVPVGAIRWDNDTRHFWWQKEGQVFWFEDESGEPIRDEVTREVLVASGVILATTPTAAARIAARSRSLESLVPLLNGVKMTPVFAAVFKTPRLAPGYYALQGAPGSPLAFVAFEEAKAPERIDAAHSLIVAHVAGEEGERLNAMPGETALARVWEDLRRVYTSLPAHPLSQVWKAWNVARPVSPLGGVPVNGRWPVNPSHAPFALAGDYLFGDRAEDAARSGQIAADLVLAQLPARR